MASLYDYIEQRVNPKEQVAPGKRARPRYERAHKELQMKLKHQKLNKAKERSLKDYMKRNPKGHPLRDL